jgi:hypothetical protein
MKKLSVVLLAIVLIFGLAVQVGADVKEVEKDAFAGDELITFDDEFLSRADAITTQYEPLGVVFSEGWYWEDRFGIFYWDMPYAAGNINPDNNYETTPTPIRMNFVDPVTRVGLDILSLNSTEIIVNVYRDGADPSSIIYRDTDSMFIGVDDPGGIDAIEISANGDFSTLTDFVVIDNLMFGGVPEAKGPKVIEFVMDIKPRNCLNPFNVNSRAKVPVVIVGRADFDVSQIDPASIRLSILEANLEDSMQSVTALTERMDDFGYCNAQEPDGFQDLKVKFDTQELVATLEYSLGAPLKDEHLLVLQLSGNLYEEYGGTQIIGKDSVAILAKTEKKKHWKKHSKKHSKKHWKKHSKEHSKEHPKKHWLEKLKEKWKTFKEKWKTKRQK